MYHDFLLNHISDHLGNEKHYLSKKRAIPFLFFMLRYNVIMEFTKRLMNWYHENKRDLAFRNDQDPYKIWVSEVMAQQTQIATMLPYFNRWIAKWPTIESVASADIQEILKMWEGLGYYNRARNLHKGAQFVMENFDGALPRDKKLLMTIPGIGEYTSSAIAAIAFELPEIPVDGNVKRVMARYLNYTENVNTRKSHVYFEEYLKEKLIIGGAKPSEFTQALMELGALVCTKDNPQCIGCPFKEMCAAYRGETVGEVPYIPKAKKVPVYNKSVLIYIKNNQILISNDHRDGLMKGLLRLPQIEGHLKAKAIYNLRHKFTHLEWNIRVYLIDELMDFDFDTFLIPLETLNDITMVRAHRKILEYLESEKVIMINK